MRYADFVHLDCDNDMKRKTTKKTSEKYVTPLRVGELVIQRANGGFLRGGEETEKLLKEKDHPHFVGWYRIKRLKRGSKKLGRQ